MSVPKLRYSPVRSRRGKLVHGTSLHHPTKTACGLTFRRWVISLEVVDCRQCLLAMCLDARPRRKR